MRFIKPVQGNVKFIFKKTKGLSDRLKAYEKIFTFHLNFYTIFYKIQPLRLIQKKKEVSIFYNGSLFLYKKIFWEVCRAVSSPLWLTKIDFEMAVESWFTISNL